MSTHLLTLLLSLVLTLTGATALSERKSTTCSFLKIQTNDLKTLNSLDLVALSLDIDINKKLCRDRDSYRFDRLEAHVKFLKEYANLKARIASYSSTNIEIMFAEQAKKISLLQARLKTDQVFQDHERIEYNKQLEELILEIEQTRAEHETSPSLVDTPFFIVSSLILGCISFCLLQSLLFTYLGTPRIIETVKEVEVIHLIAQERPLPMVITNFVTVAKYILISVPTVDELMLAFRKLSIDQDIDDLTQAFQGLSINSDAAL
jgi:hypothetical protein